MKIVQQAFAGTLESSDVLIRVSPAETHGITIELNSSVMKQFGDVIESVVRATLTNMGVTDATVIVDDKGALDCVLRARVQAAAMRAANITDIDWSKLA